MFKKKYIYMMRFPDIVTIQHISRIHKRVVDHREEQLHLWDAMEAGLVPIFRVMKEGRV